jgi:hypothetical protein
MARNPESGGGAITCDPGSPANVTIARETNTTAAKAISHFILHGMMSCCFSVSAHYAGISDDWNGSPIHSKILKSSRRAEVRGHLDEVGGISQLLSWKIMTTRAGI